MCIFLMINDAEHLFLFKQNFRGSFVGFPCSSDGKKSVMQENLVQSLGQKHPLEKGMATHSSILAWRILWTDHGVRKNQTQLSD